MNKTTVSEMIAKLQSLYAEVGDVEVLITDGYQCQGYRGSYDIQKWTENGENFVDIGIGGCME